MFKAIKQNGIVNTISKLWRYSWLKNGKLVGVDMFGNRYYEDLNANHCRERYVEYAEGAEEEPANVPAEWHQWLHKSIQSPPSLVEYKVGKAYVGHDGNLTGSTSRYVPFSTTKPKITKWKAETLSRQ